MGENERKGGDMATMTTTATRWALNGRGYEFFNSDVGCGCNFGGFPKQIEYSAGRMRKNCYGLSLSHAEGLIFVEKL